jgi:hypothetical protein
MAQSIGLGGDDRRVIPLRVEWKGMFAGSALYTGVVGLAFLPLALRRWSRARHGRCLSCGYELAGLPTCPECGRTPAAPMP